MVVGVNRYGYTANAGRPFEFNVQFYSHWTLRKPNLACKERPLSLYVMAHSMTFIFCKDMNKGDEFQMSKEQFLDLYKGVTK